MGLSYVADFSNSGARAPVLAEWATCLLAWEVRLLVRFELESL